MGLNNTTSRHTSSAVQGSSRIIVTCPQCKSKSQVPGNIGTIEVTCPQCKNKFRYYTGAKITGHTSSAQTAHSTDERGNSHMRTLTISNYPNPDLSTLDQRKLEFLLDGKSIAVLKPNESASFSINDGSHTIEVRLTNLFGTEAWGSVSARESIISDSKDVCVDATLSYGKMRVRLYVLATAYPSVVAVPDYGLEQFIAQAAVAAVQSEDFINFFNDRRNTKRSVEVCCKGTGIVFSLYNNKAKGLSTMVTEGHTLHRIYSFAASGFYLTAKQQNDKQLIHRLTGIAVNAIVANTKFKKASIQPNRITL